MQIAFQLFIKDTPPDGEQVNIGHPSSYTCRLHVGYMVQSENGKFVVPDLTLTYQDKKARQPRRIK